MTWDERFDGFLARLGTGRRDLGAAWRRLLFQLYSEPHRHYHSVRHIMNLLDRLDALRPFSEGTAFRPGLDRLLETECAIWFHDAIYIIGSPHN